MLHPNVGLIVNFFVERQDWRSWLCGPQFLSHLLTKVKIESLNTSLLKDKTLFQWKDVTVLVQISCHDGPRSNYSLPGHGRQLNAHGLAGRCWSSKLICAWASKVIFGEETLSLGTKMIVRLTWYAKPHTTGLPMNTARAPSANALSTSVPCLIPPSTKTSTFPSTAFTTSGRASIYK